MAQYGERVDVADWFSNFCTVFKRGCGSVSTDGGEPDKAQDEAAGQAAAGQAVGRGRRGRPRKKQIANQARREKRLPCCDNFPTQICCKMRFNRYC